MNDEYIKREAVIKGFTDLLQKPGDIYPTDITTMMQRIPAADVRPVVRCGDCMWFQCNMRQDGSLPHNVSEYECRHWCGPCDPTDYCSYGEPLKGGMPMKNYIEREKVFKDLLDQCKITGYGGLTANDVKYVFSLQANADVKPVVRGEWTEHGEPNQFGQYESWYWKCSICGGIACHNEYNFCPFCGADMRGE